MCTTSSFSLGNRGGGNPLGEVRKIKKRLVIFLKREGEEQKL